jgi:hypothetical protein
MNPGVTQRRKANKPPSLFTIDDSRLTIDDSLCKSWAHHQFLAARSIGIKTFS